MPIDIEALKPARVREHVRFDVTQQIAERAAYLEHRIDGVGRTESGLGDPAGQLREEHPARLVQVIVAEALLDLVGFRIG